MEVGIAQLIASFGYPGITDQQVYAEELRVAMLGEELGDDHLSVLNTTSKIIRSAPIISSTLPTWRRKPPA